MEIDSLYTAEPAAKKPRLGELSSSISTSAIDSDPIFPEDRMVLSGDDIKVEMSTSVPSEKQTPPGHAPVETDGGTPAASIPGLFLLQDPSQASIAQYMPSPDPIAVGNNNNNINDEKVKAEETGKSDHDSSGSSYSPADLPTPSEPIDPLSVIKAESMEDNHPSNGITAPAAESHIKSETNNNEGIMTDPSLLERNVAADGEGENGEPEWEWDSSNDEDSSSDSSSDSDSSSGDDDSDDDDDSDSDKSVKEEDSDAEDAVYSSIAQEAKRLMEEEDGGGSDDDGGPTEKKVSKGGLRTKNELSEDHVKVQRPQIEIPPDAPITHLGYIESIVDNLLLIKATVSGEYQVLNEGSLIVFEDKAVLGTVQDTIGRVEEPLYTVRFNNSEELESAGATVQKKVFYVPSHSTFVFTKALRAVKGSDASNLYDEEVQEEEQEFSDDEAEAEYKRKKKQARKGGDNAHNNNNNKKEGGGAGSKRQREVGELDEPYIPLTRPQNLEQLMRPGSNNPSSRQEPSERNGPFPGAQRSNSVPGWNNNNSRGGEGGRGRGGFQRGGGSGGGFNQRGGRGGGRGNFHQQHQQQPQYNNHNQSRGGRGGSGTFGAARNNSWAQPDSSRLDYDSPAETHYKPHIQDPSRYYSPQDYSPQSQQQQQSSYQTPQSRPSSSQQAMSPPLPQGASFIPPPALPQNLPPTLLSVMTQLANATANANSNHNNNNNNTHNNSGNNRPQLSPLATLPPFPGMPPQLQMPSQISPTSAGGAGSGGDGPIALPSGAHVNPAFFRRQSFPLQSPALSDSYQSPPGFGSPPSTAMSPAPMSPQTENAFQSVQEILRRLQPQ